MSIHRIPSCAILAGLIAAVTTPAEAGMPTASLTDLARMRLDAISFFLAVLVACSFGVKVIWNSFSNEFEKLPRLNFRKSFGLVALWGMLFVVVLTMISGARELMTPGAWQQDGFTYSLSEAAAEEAAPVALVSRDERKDHLKALWGELSRYALRNEGRFPSKRDAEVVPIEYWTLPDVATVRYHYLEGRTANQDDILAFEPAVFDDMQFALMTSGTIGLVSPEDIAAALNSSGEPASDEAGDQ